MSLRSDNSRARARSLPHSIVTRYEHTTSQSSICGIYVKQGNERRRHNTNTDHGGGRGRRMGFSYNHMFTGREVKRTGLRTWWDIMKEHMVDLMRVGGEGGGRGV